MPVDLLRVPPDGPTAETVTDRRTGRSWTVTVRPFEIAPTVVTVAQWNAVRGDPTPPAVADRPRVEVSWRQAITFCNDLSRRDGLTPVYTITPVPAAPSTTTWTPHDEPAPDDRHVAWDETADGYRLPTEAEWQVACRAGTTGPRYADLDAAGWYEANSAGALPPVARKTPNAWGLYDTLGGVWEWCWDLYDEAVYGPYRIIRGGGWNDPRWSCRVGVRRKTNPQAAFDDLGFRLARTRHA